MKKIRTRLRANRIHIALLLALCASALSALDVGAQPAWLQPRHAVDIAGSATKLEVESDARGNLVAAWFDYSECGYECYSWQLMTSHKPVGGDWSPPEELGDPSHRVDPPQQSLAVSPGGRAALAWGATLEGTFAVTGRAGRSWGSVETLSNAFGFSPDAEVDRRGNVLVAWTEAREVQIAKKSARGAWREGRRVSPEGEDALYSALALNGSGAGMVTWWHEFPGDTAKLVGRYRAGRLDAWGTLEDISDPTSVHNLDPTALEVDGSGRAIAAWSRFVGGTRQYELSERPIESGIWQPAVPMDNGSASYYPPQVFVTPAGHALAIAMMWKPGGQEGFLMARTKPRGGVWSSLEAVTPEGDDSSAGEPSLAGMSKNRVLVSWVLHDSGQRQVQASLARPGTGSWSGPENLSSPVSTFLNAFGVAADSNGNAVAVFNQGNVPEETLKYAPYDGAGPLMEALKVPAQGQVSKAISFSVKPLDLWSALAGNTRWSFGDRTSATGNGVSHRYTEPGKFVVTVKRADELGNLSTVKRTIKIERP